jgi:NDP-sugar pyrophosphorylase family protein
MYELMPMLEGDEAFVLTTVDTVFRESEFLAYVAAFEKMVAAGEADGLMGVTTYIDDEKPLYVATDDDLNIRAFLDADENPRYVSGGIYGLTPRALATLRRCVDRGESRMRNFQRALLTDGLWLKAFLLTKVIDVDHASDIAKAEALLH